MPRPLSSRLSVILPARDEARSLEALLPRIRAVVADAEILVVDDGSRDDTVALCKRLGVRVVSHPVARGNGAAVKTGARHARGEVLVLLDADGQHRPEDIPGLLEAIASGYDMAVGARERSSQAGVHRALANAFYNRFASWMAGQRVLDLTSGFRAVRARLFRRFLYLLPNGFSYPTTITMSFFRAGHTVAYVPIQTDRRIGRSHVRLMRDGARFLIIIFKVGTLYAPLKVFLPVSFLFGAIGVGYYLYVYLLYGRFNNVSIILLISAILVFLIGLISEQITALNYKDSESGPIED